MKEKRNKKITTSVIIDIRNFSKTFKEFQNNDSDLFLDFIDEYYLGQHTIAKAISEDYHIASIGDGIMTNFMDEKKQCKEAYAYILASHRYIQNLCDKFMRENEGTYLSFGMGADLGNVWSVGGDGVMKNYVGTAINRASRIEGVTKMFGEVTTAIGNSLYMNLLKEFHIKDYKAVKVVNDYDKLLTSNTDAVLASKKFLLYFLFNMPLKGIQENAPIFRMSKSLSSDDNLYWNLMNSLVGSEKTNNIKNIINEK